MRIFVYVYYDKELSAGPGCWLEDVTRHVTWRSILTSRQQFGARDHVETSFECFDLEQNGRAASLYNKVVIIGLSRDIGLVPVPLTRNKSSQYKNVTP